MLPLHQANEVRDSLKAYLNATFDFLDPGLRNAFEAFVNHPDEGIFKGPYLSVKLPFVKADARSLEELDMEVKPVWPPYQHQISSWQRLSTRSGAPAPTLVTTGTGSGKTESFLYPILDYCHAQQHRRGIKCIILYPMNALATDQAKRLAEIIHEDDRLRGRITAGLFIGESNGPGLPTMMGPDRVVEQREAILKEPPDILLTNFKMLDYSLMRHRFQRLWEGNFEDVSLLQFLVLDEMHTYDGAQGSDVANLIRRLKLKLQVPEGQLCPVGTSATLGSGEGATRDLAHYASTLFGEEVGEEAVITESRVSIEDYFGSADVLDDFLPRQSFLGKHVLQRDADYRSYIEQLATMWQLDSADLAGGLRGLRAVHDLVACCAEAPGIHRLDDVVGALERRNPALRAATLNTYSLAEQRLLVESLVALIGAAREGNTGMPMLFVQVQLWIRELSGFRRRLSLTPSFHWRDEQIEPGEPKHMPPWFCRDCGASGWLVSKADHKDSLDNASDEGTNRFFSNDKKVHFLIPSAQLSRLDAAAGGYDTRDSFEAWLHPATLELNDVSSDETLQVFGARRLDAEGRNDHICPSCNTRNSLSIIGSRVATLGSITVSQALASDFDASPERERKVLAFTNSVQDAAHQAGFIEARNYRFTMRTSIQRVLKLAGRPLTLPELQEAFRAHWMQASDDQGQGDVAAYYNRFFPKDYIGRSEPEDYKQNGRFLPVFEDAFQERMEWEVMNEFAFESQLGRTLEKTGCSGMWWDAEQLRRTAEGLEAWLERESKPGQVSREALPAFIALIAHRLRIRGAMHHPLLARFREGNFHRDELNWYNSPRHILHRWFSARVRLPRMVIHVPHNQGMADTTFSSRPTAAGSPNWFHAYFRKTFTLANEEPAFINEFYERLFQAGVEAGLFHREGEGRDANHAMHPEAMWIADGVEEFQCSSCGHKVFEGMGKAKVELDGGKCLQYRCQGIYSRLTTAKEPNYYQLVYNRSRSPRVIAREHTGLLERKVRELLETDFKNRTKFNAPNTLVATSTLEMGIDIGSLQIAINTSVPPTPASFLQRVGRAGRKTGTALVVNFATRRSHDQYYFAEPAEMMAGEVTAPGCYLEAREILRRHYFAFCIDSWTGANPQDHHIPSMVRHLKLMQTDVLGPSFFMNRILSFVSENEDSLLSRFLEAYRGKVSENTLLVLTEWVKSPQFVPFHQQVFARLKSELESLQKLKAAIARRIQEERLQPGDDLYDELLREQRSVGGIFSNIEKRMVLEHLTNVGVLPNYAFPETGVTLNARVFKQTGMQAVRSPLNKEYVIVRPASQALRELVPGSAFYSQGYRFEIGGLSLHDLAGEGEHYMRFCSACDYIAESSTSIEHVPCPKCGDESWMANSNRHRVAHLASVRSSTSSSKSRVVDHHETRQSDPFHISRHFKFNRSAGAYAIQAANFGIEFVRETQVTEFNLGLEGRGTHANVMEINGAKYPRHGFITCKTCGKSTPRPLKDAPKYHYGYCPHADVVWTDASTHHFHELYLFRQMSTEALKVLVPVQDVDTSGAGLELFQAGLELGFRKYFKGNPQHLLLRPYQEFNRSSGRKDLYIIILDAVPGGTGYLEKLFTPEQFGEVLRLAHDAMAECTCQLAGKDGCYRCVFSYRNQRAHEELSRKAGVEMFKGIVDRLDGWERMVDGLDAIAQTGRLEESELERKFINVLRKHARSQSDWTWNEENVDGQIHYTLKISEHLAYHIQPQVELGHNQGFSSPTRPDFLITATRYLVNGEEKRHVLPQWAIFLDGFQYHASAQHRRFEGDVVKREQLRLHPGYAVWTLTWDDVLRFEQGLGGEEGGNAVDFVADTLASHPCVQHALTLARGLHREQPRLHSWRNNVDRLFALLENPAILPRESKSEWAVYFATFQEKLFHKHHQEVEHALVQYMALPVDPPRGKTLDFWLPLQLPKRVTPIAEVRACVNLHSEGDIQITWEAGTFEEPAKEDWEAFWTWYNMFQFFPWRSAPVAQVSPERLYVHPQAQSVMSLAAEPEGLEVWLEQMQLSFPDFSDQIQELWNAGYFQKPEDEDTLTEICNERGESLFTADFVHPRTKEVYGVTDPEAVAWLKARGYKIVD